jgi:hypothetical protein
MFEYPIACPRHPNIDGHVFFHIFEKYAGVQISVDMTGLTAIPLSGRLPDILLTMMAIPESQYRLLSDHLRRRNAHEQCLAVALEINKELRASQYSMLEFLSHLPARLMEQDGEQGFILCPEELAGMSMGVINALDLPTDPRVAPVIPGIVSGILDIKELMYRRHYREEWENQAADREATTAIDKLMSHLAGMRIFGGQNCRLLSCAQTRDIRSPAVGWLPMHIE